MTNGWLSKLTLIGSWNKPRFDSIFYIHNPTIEIGTFNPKVLTKLQEAEDELACQTLEEERA